MLLDSGSRNAAYLAAQAAEHLIRAVATSEDLHIQRKDAHQLDSTVRRVPDVNPDRAALQSITFLEAYATAYRYPTPTGRMPSVPSKETIEGALDQADRLIVTLSAYFGVELTGSEPAKRVEPRRIGTS